LGAGGRMFRCYKFRSMRQHAEQVLQIDPHLYQLYVDNNYKLPPHLDPRLTGIGSLLRKTRLDELPQLLNVLVGDMSLVGPRPLLPQDQPAAPAVRLMVRPGITGWAQVNGGALLSPAEKEALDEWYIGRAGLAFDLRIVAITALSLIRADRRSAQALARARGLRVA